MRIQKKQIVETAARRSVGTGPPAPMRQAKRKENKAMMNLQESKKNALQAYKEAKNNYLQNMTAENWREFCEAKMNCMRLGVII